MIRSTLVLLALMIVGGCGSSSGPTESHDDEHGHEQGDHEEAGQEEGHEDGRTTIAAKVAQSMGVVTSEAGPVTLKETLSLSGVIQADPARVSRVRARFPGVVRQVAVEPWVTVSRGALLAQVQSNESLQNYSITAPIGGVLVEHRAQVGEATGEESLDRKSVV